MHVSHIKMGMRFSSLKNGIHKEGCGIGERRVGINFFYKILPSNFYVDSWQSVNTILENRERPFTSNTTKIFYDKSDIAR